MNGKNLVLVLFCSGFALSAMAGSGSDSQGKGKKNKEPKHYLYNTIYTEYYTTPKRDILNQKNLDLGSYNFSQSNTGFYFPIKTRDIHKDSVTIANLHTLIVGNFLKSTPRFDSISDNHHLVRASLGLRIMYNNGKKNVWFFNFAPYWTQDDRFSGNATGRFSTIIVFNRTVSKDFSFRLGFTRTFIFGNKYHLPVIGLRFGPLDGVYVSMQFPRNVSVNFPVGKRFYGSIYCKPFGGVYNFANDTLRSGPLYNGRDSLLQFGRREFITGARLDLNATKNFSFFLSSGLSAFNQVAFFSNNYNKSGIQSLRPFYYGSLSNSYFLNFGLTWRFGQVKKVYNNYTMYDLIDMNNTLDPGDVNDGPGNGDIPSNGKRTSIKDVQYKDVKDLIELGDDY